MDTTAAFVTRVRDSFACQAFMGTLGAMLDEVGEGRITIRLPCRAGSVACQGDAYDAETGPGPSTIMVASIVARCFPWIGSPHEGAGSLHRAELTLDRIRRLDAAQVISGHGPPIDDVAGAVERTRERLAGWAADPLAGVLHAAKRIFTYRLMLEAIREDRVHAYLQTPRGCATSRRPSITASTGSPSGSSTRSPRL